MMRSLTKFIFNYLESELPSYVAKLHLLIWFYVFVGLSIAASEDRAFATEIKASDMTDRITGEDGHLSYNFAKKPEEGWYEEPGSPGKHHVAYKQGNRDSNHPSEVASLIVSHKEHFRGNSSIELSVVPFQEDRPKSTAFYKVGLSGFSNSAGSHFVPVFGRAQITHKFAMKVDPTRFSLNPGQNVIFEQFWQGSPFHPPVSLQMMSAEDARRQGWSVSAANGHFALCLIDDDHGPSGLQSGTPQFYDLGEIALGSWLQWEIRVVPSPALGQGSISVLRDTKQILSLENVKVGYNPESSIYITHKPSKFIESIEIMIYRQNGSSSQTLFFDDISVAVEPLVSGRNLR